MIEIKRLVIILLASGLLTPSLASVASAGQSNTIWSANFETGDHSQFNQCSVQPGGANPPAVATNIVHTGTYSEYDYYDGDGGTGLPHRSYCGEAFNVANQYTSIENDVWIYVPSSVNGTVQDYETWFTFVNLFFARSDGSSKGALVVMGCTSGGGYPCDHRQLSLNTGPFSSGHVIIASNNVTWPFDQWFGLRTLITQTSGLAVIMLYEVLNGSQQLVMKVSSTTVNLYFYQAHWGLYDGPLSGVSAIYNDDIRVINLAPVPQLRTSTVTRTSTSTSPSTLFTNTTTSTPMSATTESASSSTITTVGTSSAYANSTNSNSTTTTT